MTVRCIGLKISSY